jgi:CRP/FNR family cyclic AMP-dependent transcriptional regulator
MDAKRLQTVHLFSTLSKKEREQLARWIDQVDVPEGTELTHQGSFAYEFFVIDDGAASVRKDGELISEMGPGDFFGEIALLEADRRTATVTATTPMRLLVMHSRDFRAMEKEMPVVADRIRAAIRARLD